MFTLEMRLIYKTDHNFQSNNNVRETKLETDPGWLTNIFDFHSAVVITATSQKAAFLYLAIPQNSTEAESVTVAFTGKQVQIVNRTSCSIAVQASDKSMSSPSRSEMPDAEMPVARKPNAGQSNK